MEKNGFSLLVYKRKRQLPPPLFSKEGIKLWLLGYRMEESWVLTLIF